MSDSMPAFETQLRARGVHVTAQRLAIMQAVAERPHVTADDVIEAVRDRLGSVSRQAVYDSLGVLTDQHLVRRIEPAGSPARYEDRTGDNHHHLICRSCRLMFDVDCAVNDTPCLTASDDHGFEIDEAEVVYWGRCPDCRAAAEAELAASAPSLSNRSTHTEPSSPRSTS